MKTYFMFSFFVLNKPAHCKCTETEKSKRQKNLSLFVVNCFKIWIKRKVGRYQPFLNQPKPKLNQKPNHHYGEYFQTY